jgi:hypothetical protein
LLHECCRLGVQPLRVGRWRGGRQLSEVDGAEKLNSDFYKALRSQVPERGRSHADLSDITLQLLQMLLPDRHRAIVRLTCPDSLTTPVARLTLPVR